MSDEKTLLNDKFKKDEEKNSDIMDFSSAFNDDYDEPEQNSDEIGEPVGPVPSFLKSLPFLKKKKEEKAVSEENEEVAEEEIKEEAIEEEIKIETVEEKEEKAVEAPAEIRTEEKTEDESVKKDSVKENKKNKNKQEKKKEVVETAEDDSPEFLELGNAIVFAEEDDEPEKVQDAEPEKKSKGFSLLSKKEKTPEPEENEELPKEKLVPSDEPQDFPGLGNAIVFAEEDDEPEEVQKTEPEKKSKGFSLFGRKEKTPEPEKNEEPPEEILISLNESNVKISDEPILFLGNFEDEKSEEPVIIVSQSEKTEDNSVVSENDAEAEEPVEMLPSFEEQETVTEEIKEETVEEKAQDAIKELPPFEETVVKEEVIKELPPFEETVAQTEVIEEIPPFEEPAEGEKEVVEEAPASKKKKEKKQKPPKEKKAKKAEATDAQQEKTTQLMTAKDHLTFILIILALILTIAFVVVKFIPLGNNGAQNVNTVTKAGENVSEIQIQREGALGHCIQSNIENVFYMYSQEGSPAYYKCDNGRMIPLSATGSVQAIATLGQDKIPVKLDYVEIDGQLFGTGVFRAKDTEGSFLHSIAIFKLVNLPKGYEQDGKALLLATTNEDALSEKCNVWTDSYVVDLETGVTKRFLTSDNNLFSTGYSILTDEGYASTNGKIPFLTTREYDAVTNKKDIYIKDGNKEASFATDVAGNFIYADGDTVCYLKSTDNGFNAIKNTNGKESVIFSLRNDTSYMYFNEYLLDKYNGVLYNVKTGEQITVSGYGMSNPELMTVSGDGRYLVVIGTVNNVLDYQVHVFDLKKNSCAKYVDDNFSQHRNLNFVDNSTVVYSAVDPNQGCEYVILDISKAF